MFDRRATSLIPQTAPGAGVRRHRRAVDEAVLRVARSGSYVMGAEVEAFEAEFGAWLGAQTVSCASGTDALELALRACGVAPGSGVATVAHTAAATVAAIERAGAVPWLLDVDPATYTLDPEELATLLNRGAPIRAVVAVHLYGHPADLDALGALCRAHDLVLIEDCSQAHGATWRGRRVGTFGRAAAFSFYPTKNLGALGDGGAVAFADPTDAARGRGLRQYGWSADRVCQEAGFNSRLDALQAAVLRVRLRSLDAAVCGRRLVAKAYDEVAGTDAPVVATHAEHAYHQYVISVPDRERLRARFTDAKIATAIHYAPALHLHPAYRDRVRLGPALCRHTELLAGRVLSLPMFPELNKRQIERVRSVLAKR